MRQTKIWSTLRQFFYNKDYDGKIGKSADTLADEACAELQPILDAMPKEPSPKPDEYATIGGIRYKLEEIKK